MRSARQCDRDLGTRRCHIEVKEDQELLVLLPNRNADDVFSILVESDYFRTAGFMQKVTASSNAPHKRWVRKKRVNPHRCERKQPHSDGGRQRDGIDRRRPCTWKGGLPVIHIRRHGGRDIVWRLAWLQMGTIQIRRECNLGSRWVSKSPIRAPTMQLYGGVYLLGVPSTPRRKTLTSAPSSTA